MVILINKRVKAAFVLLLLCSIGYSQSSYGQEVVITLGRNRLPINEYFTISVTFLNQPLQNYGDFPEIEGFKKSTRTNTTSRIGLGEKAIIEQIITQHYAALDEGRFVLKPFSVNVNGKRVSSKGTVITILPMAAEPEENEPTPLPEPPPNSPPASKPFKSQSFLSLETDKDNIYVGEGLYVRLAFYLDELEQKNLEFHNFDQQYSEFIKQLRQKYAWEEAYEPTTAIEPDTVIIREKKFLKYNLFRKMLYPLSTKELVFQEISLIMGVRPEPIFFGDNAPIDNFFTFTTRPKTIGVKPLPPHPLSNVVPVGQYNLKEYINRLNFRTGQPFTYSLEIIGIGNMGAVLPPQAPPTHGLEIYPPETRFTRDMVAGTLQGSKIFRYNMLARQPGRYNLGNLFWLVYFDPVTSRYDTLRAKSVININKGESRQETYRPEASDPFYKLIREEENELISLNQFNEIKLYTNVVILFLLCISLFLFFKK